MNKCEEKGGIKVLRNQIIVDNKIFNDPSELDVIYFYCEDSKIYKQYHDQLCCENIYIENIQLELIKLTVDNIKSYGGNEIVGMDIIKNLAEYVITLQHNIKITDILVDEPDPADNYSVYVFTDNTEQDIRRFQIIQKLAKQGLKYQIDTNNTNMGCYNFPPVLANYKFLSKDYKCIKLYYFYTNDIVKKKIQIGI